MPLYITRNGNGVVTQVPLGMTRSGVVTRIGKDLLPFADTRDHDIGRVIEALAA